MTCLLPRNLLGLLLLFSHASSSPLSGPSDSLSPIFRRSSPCDAGQLPILYTKEYHVGDCPPALSLNSDGSCPINTRGSTCAAYCEIRQNFYYGQEIPLDNGFCHGPLTCAIQSAIQKTTTYTGGGMFSAKIMDVIMVGVTGGYSQASATTDTRTTTINLKQGQCGYFTFLPILHDSCGSLTEANFLPGNVLLCGSSSTTTPNVCSTQLYRSADGKTVLGDTVFVYTDCGNHQRLPDDQQDPAYNHPNVALPQNAFTALTKTWN